MNAATETNVTRQTFTGNELVADRIGVDLGGRTVVSDLSLQVVPGKMLGIVGPNGSGKTTLLRSLSRTLPPSRGVVLLEGADMYRRLKPSRVARQVAVVPQESPRDFGFTVAEFVLMGRHPHLSLLAQEGNEDYAVAASAMRRAGVWELRERHIGTLSGGEWQRAVIARALAQTPLFLLCDEPTAHLDIAHAVAVMDLLRALSREGLAVSVVLHDLNLAALYCDELALMQAGRLVVCGAPSDVLTEMSVSSVYGCPVRVVHYQGRPQVQLVPRHLA